MKNAIVLLSISFAACADSAEARLDHAQILAVRAEPAHVAPGEKARITILAGNDSGEVYEVAPDKLIAGVDGGTLAAERTSDAWVVTAGALPQIATLEVSLAIDGVTWLATKSLVIGQRAENPTIGMQIDGAPATEMVATIGTKPELAATPSDKDTYTYAWYSSVGDIAAYRQPTATLDAKERADGTLLLVVRDKVGGVSWQIMPARVE